MHPIRLPSAYGFALCPQPEPFVQCNFPESAWPRQIELTTAALENAGVSEIQLIHLLANSRYERTIIGHVAKLAAAADEQQRSD